MDPSHPEPCGGGGSGSASATDEVSSTTAAEGGWEQACTLEELRSAKKLLRRLRSGRGVALWYHRDQVFCLDAHCYHHGGPLVDGDIEELAGGLSCVLCPWHKYKIDLKTGDCLYIGLDLETRAPLLKSKGVKQRPHSTLVRDGSVLVKDSSAAPPEPAEPATAKGVIASDAYARIPFNAGQTVPGIHSGFGPGGYPGPGGYVGLFGGGAGAAPR